MDVCEDVDVLVVGGGPAGTCAAIACARAGAETLLVERTASLGGVATNGLLCFWGPLDNASRENDWPRMKMRERGEEWPPQLRDGERIIKGLPEEIVKHLDARGEADDAGLGFIPVNPEAVKREVEQVVAESGARVRYDTFAADAEETADGVSVTVADKQGLHRIRAKVAVDCTGDGDISAFLGAPVEKGREEDGKLQGVTLVYRLINWHIPDELTPTDVRHEARTHGIGTLMFIPAVPGVAAVNGQHTFDVDCTNSEELSRAVMKARREIPNLVEECRQHLPGFEDCLLLDTGCTLGVRETRRIMGEYVLTGDDVVAGRQFSDEVALNGYDLDIHIPGQEERCLDPGTSYGIPYRCLLPRNTERLLVAGRPISTTHVAHSSTRIMTCCMATGQAAGVAAAMAVAEGVRPREVGADDLRESLKGQHVYLGR
jgi:glycine/D-amino acid oxidase-like deaminating enzyme